MEEVQHTDKCCSWDDSEFCDCGARAIASLEQQLTAANAEIATLRHGLLNEQAASRMAHEVVARNRALEAENAQLRHALANAEVAAGFAKEMAGKVMELQGSLVTLDRQIVRWRQSSNRHLCKLIMAKGEIAAMRQQLAMLQP